MIRTMMGGASRGEMILNDSAPVPWPTKTHYSPLLELNRVEKRRHVCELESDRLSRGLEGAP